MSEESSSFRPSALRARRDFAGERTAAGALLGIDGAHVAEVLLLRHAEDPSAQGTTVLVPAGFRLNDDAQERVDLRHAPWLLPPSVTAANYVFDEVGPVLTATPAQIVPVSAAGRNGDLGRTHPVDWELLREIRRVIRTCYPKTETVREDRSAPKAKLEDLDNQDELDAHNDQFGITDQAREVNLMVEITYSRWLHRVAKLDGPFSEARLQEAWKKWRSFVRRPLDIAVIAALALEYELTEDTMTTIAYLERHSSSLSHSYSGITKEDRARGVHYWKTAIKRARTKGP